MFDTPFMKGNMLFSTKDHPGHLSTICFVDITECNLSCSDCHNMMSCKKNYKTEFLSYNEFKQHFESSIDLGTADVFVISGGEPTLHSKKLLKTLEIFKNDFSDVKIRIDTNGQLPDEVEKIKPFVDGFAVDIKVPIKERYGKIEKERFSQILGIDDVNYYMKNLSRTIELVDGMLCTLFRTVKYKYFLDDDIEKIDNFVRDLKSPHYWNDFFVGDHL